MLASAWTTLVCYASMVIICYLLGQKYYPVPYPVRRTLTYLLTIVVLYFIQHNLGNLFPEKQYILLRLATGFALLILFLLLVFRLEKKELKGMLVFKKYSK
ncbi:hypothetical protein D3C86_1716790 [compost metagenome]